MSVIDTWNNLPTWGKWGIGLGLGGLLLYIIMHKGTSRSTQPTLTSQTTAPSLGSDVMGGSDNSGTYDPTNQNGSQDNGTSGLGSSGGTSGSGSSGTGVPSVSNTPSPIPTAPVIIKPQSKYGTETVVSTTSVTQTTGGKTTTVSAPIAQSFLNAQAVANPGSPIVAMNSFGNKVGYSIAKADSNGVLHVGKTYNEATNLAGGQWLTDPSNGKHIDFKGHYESGGRFITDNKKQQSIYDRIVKKNPKPRMDAIKPVHVGRGF